MKTILLTVCSALLSALTAAANYSQVILLPTVGTKVGLYEEIDLVLPLDPFPIAVVEVDLTILFPDGWVRLLPTTQRWWDPLVMFDLHRPGYYTGTISGTGEVLGQDLAPLLDPLPLYSGSSSGGIMAAGFFPVWHFDPAAKVDIYGLHYEMTLQQNVPGIPQDAIVFEGKLRLAGGPFIIAPLLPDTGSTAALLIIGLAALLAYRRHKR